jgi:capsular polysaccharide transport system ATP-binding protein
MIELHNVTKCYPVQGGGLRYIMRDVSLSIPSRTNMAVIGPNGAGKSTFLRIVGGAEGADSGTIVSDAEISWPLGLTSGFQSTLSGRQNVLFVCHVNGLDRSQCRDVIGQIIDFTELGEYFDMPVKTYSSGMRAKLSFGLSMAFDFDVYLIDELTSVGDTIFREKAKAAFEKIRKRASLIYASHNLNSLRESCQSALFLREGQADFYQNVEDGIDAYTQYVREHRNHGLTKDGRVVRITAGIDEHGNEISEEIVEEFIDEKSAKRAEKKAAKKAEKQAIRAADKKAEKLAVENDPELAMKKAAEQAAKKAEKQAAKDAEKKAAKLAAQNDPELIAAKAAKLAEKLAAKEAAKQAAKLAAQNDPKLAAEKAAKKAEKLAAKEAAKQAAKLAVQNDPELAAEKAAKKAAKKAEKKTARRGDATAMKEADKPAAKAEGESSNEPNENRTSQPQEL